MAYDIDFSQLDLSLCYLSGLVAAGTPCVVVLIPLILFRFRGHVDRHLLYFVIGFLVTYAGLGLMASKVLSSPLQNGIRLGLGGSFVVLGTLTINGKISPIDLPFKDNSLLLGVGFAMLISVNPCTLPFLGLVISLHPANAFLSLMVFGMGMLTPSLLFVLLGKASIRVFTNCGNVMNALSKGMNWVLATSGFYLMLSVYTVSLLDLAVASTIFFVELFFVAKMYPVSSPRPFQIASLLLVLTCAVLFTQTFWVHSDTAHYVEVPTPPPPQNPNIKTATLPPGAAQLSCIDPALLYCELCQKHVLVYVSAVFLVACYMYLLDSEWLQQRLGSYKLVAYLLNPLQFSEISADLKMLSLGASSGQMSPVEYKQYQEELAAVRHRVMNMA